MSSKRSVNALAHSSVAVATANTGNPGQSIVSGNGNVAITGAVTSCTWMICAAIATFPQASVAVQVRVVVYSPLHAPDTVASL